ncbi:MAG: hypothetical protein ACKKMV_03435 [Candidatus Nealsonbacteria bacterium]|nr:MAG: hypothetical protein IB617_02235 [Candidatus Nealsonbacteria bacterium]
MTKKIEKVKKIVRLLPFKLTEGSSVTFRPNYYIGDDEADFLKLGIGKANISISTIKTLRSLPGVKSISIKHPNIVEVLVEIGETDNVQNAIDAFVQLFDDYYL